MATSRQVKCIIQSSGRERHERITHIGGDWGRITETDAIYYIEVGSFEYFVKVGGYETKVIIAERYGKKYLKTIADTTTTDNLLSLPTCN